MYFGSLWKTSRAKACELKLVNADGETFAARMDCIPTGGPAALRLLVVSDISDRKKAEEELQSVAGQNPSPVLRVSRDGIILYAMTPAPVSRLMELPVGIRSARRNSPAHQDRPETGAAIEAEVARPCHLLLSIAPIVSEGYVNLYGRDITDRKRMEVLLRKRNDFLNEVLESLTHPFCVIDAADHRIPLIRQHSSRTARPHAAARDERMFHSIFEPGFCKTSEQVKRTGKPVIIEQVHYDALGSGGT